MIPVLVAFLDVSLVFELLLPLIVCSCINPCGRCCPRSDLKPLDLKWRPAGELLEVFHRTSEIWVYITDINTRGTIYHNTKFTT